MYNVFSNDLLFILDKLNDISVYNYADDTTITCSDVNYDTAHTKLLAASDIMISWFENNNLQANPNKFQLIVFEEASEERSLAIHILARTLPWRVILQFRPYYRHIMNVYHNFSV